MLDVALEHKIIQKSGSYFSFGDERLGQGRTNVKAFLVEHPDITAKVLGAIQEKLPDAVVPVPEPSPEDPVKMPVSGGKAADPETASSNGAPVSSVE